MEFLGIGPLELVFIIIIILLIVGPQDVARVSRTLGRGLNRLSRSENYKLIQKASAELRNLPQQLMREANLEELEKMAEIPELKDGISINPPEKSLKAWVEELPSTPPPSAGPKSDEAKDESAAPTAPPSSTNHPSA